MFQKNRHRLITMKTLKNISFLFLFPVLFLCENGFAMTLKLQADKLGNWNAGPGNGSDGTLGGGLWCQTYQGAGGGANIFIGTPKGAKVDPKYDDEYGVKLMVARQTSVGGARFCPTAINSGNKGGRKAWTTYHELDGQCVWLCHSDYTGPECEQKKTDTGLSCDPTLLYQKNYDSLSSQPSRTTATNIEALVPNFYSNHVHHCNYNNDNGADIENDWILIIHDWLPSGHGAWVRAYQISSSFWSDDDTSQIQPFPANGSKSVLGCKNGYKPNDAGDDCVAINKTKCGEMDWCSGWNGETNFDSAKHLQFTDGDCLKWRCKESGYALASAGSAECVAVETTSQGENSTGSAGVNPSNGTAVKCPAGKLFDATATEYGYCVDAYPVGKHRMLYGNGVSSSDISKQCWTITDPDKYKDCVLDGIDVE